MTPTQLVALALLIAATLAVVVTFILTWRKATLPKKPSPPKTAAAKLPISRGRPPHFYPPKSSLQPQRHRLPKSFTNRPGVKQSQVNLKKAGYREDAKIEEEPRKRRR